MEDSSDFPQLKSLLKLKKRYDAPKVKDLPNSYKRNEDKEKLYIWAAENFLAQLRHKFPKLKPQCLVLKNECGTPKISPTFIKPTVLPFDHLFDLEECSKFVSDFVQYSPGETGVPLSMNSPTMVLATQIGNSLEMSCILVSFLVGFGFDAYVICGEVDQKTYLKDLEDKEYVPTSDEENECTLDAVDARSATVNALQPKKYIVEKPREMKSKYMKFLEEIANETNSKLNPSLELNDPFKQTEDSANSSTNKTVDPFHAWAYVNLTSKAGIFYETTTGRKEKLSNLNYKLINCAWNGDNYWVAKNQNWRNNAQIDFTNENDWIPLISSNLRHNEENANTDISLKPPIKEAFPSQSESSLQKRLLPHPKSWMSSLDIPRDSYELMYRLGQKTSSFSGVKVEYYAPYLLKEGLVRRVQRFDDRDETKVKSVIEKFRQRKDKLVNRETYPEKDCVIEKFDRRRCDQMKLHAYLRLSHTRTMEFYAQARLDKLKKRVSKAWELEEKYEDREDRLKEVQVFFTIAEKKFGPAETSKSGKEVVKIIERFKECRDVIEDTSFRSLVRTLDSKDIFERIFDFENSRIFLKFFHEKEQIFCKTVDFYAPTGVLVEDLSPEDIKVYIVDPRDPKPSFYELRDLFKEQLTFQNNALKRVEKSEIEINNLLEDRMKELSANELDVWLFDVKRNVHVAKGRQEKAALKRDKDDEVGSTLDVDIDFLAPYLAKYDDLESMTKPQATQVRDECLNTIRMSLKNKEEELSSQIQHVKHEIEANKNIWIQDNLNSKKFFLNVLEMRLLRQQKSSIIYYNNAESKVTNDQRIKNFFK